MEHQKIKISLLLTLMAAMISFPSLGSAQNREVLSDEQEETKAAKDEAKPTGGVPGTRPHQSALGIEMVEIPAGRFTMGSPGSETGRDLDEREHDVVISRPFLAGKYEVTQGLWEKIMGNNPSHYNNCGEACPVERVSWHEAVEFCNRLSEREGLSPAYRISGKDVTWDRSADGYRLPTEAEWEYACRAGTQSAFYTGRANGWVTEQKCGHDPSLDRAGWYCGNAKSKPHPVGQKTPNAWGLYDMHGNVSEGCWDRYGDYPTGEVTDPAGPSSGRNRVSRGGGWPEYAGDCRSADRFWYHPMVPRVQYYGFRLFRSP